MTSSPTAFVPATPSARSSYYTAKSYAPLRSSPLASPTSSPIMAVQERRRSQYKSKTSSSISFATPSSTSASCSRRKTSGAGADVFGTIATPSEDPQTTFLRARFKARCVERAARNRAETVKKRRASGSDNVFLDSDAGGGGAMDCSDGEEEDEEALMQDELFRRIVSNTKHKQKHSFRLSYSHDVGSSFDPDMEDVNEWEQELRQQGESTGSTLEDLEEEELTAYAEEFAAIQDFADIDLSSEDFSAWSDTDDVPLPSPTKSTAATHGSVDEDEGMDMS